MKRGMTALAVTAIMAVASVAGGMREAGAETISHGRFPSVEILHPKGTPTSVVLFLSGEQGWTHRSSEQARALADEGALVAEIDMRKLAASLAQDGECTFPEGDLDNLGRFVQAYEKLPTYTPPVLVGEGAGGTLAYTLIALGQKGTFSGVISIGFCPVLPLRLPLCKGAGTQFTWDKKRAVMTLSPAPALNAPWTVIQAAPGHPAAQGAQAAANVTDAACDATAVQRFVARVPGARLAVLPPTARDSAAFAARLAQLKASLIDMKTRVAAVAPPVPPPAAVSDLPVAEVPATGGGNTHDALAIFISGDGGWAGIDKEVGAALAQAGVPVVGVDSLRYFWTPRTPATTAADIDRLIRYYTAHWHKRQVLLIGYSQGADVLPFVVNRLPAASRERVALAAMMGLGQRADFEFHMSHWLSSSTDGLPIAPEAKKMPPGIGLCIYGAEETDSNCPALDPQRVTIVKLPGGHHFDGNYGHLAQLILDAARTK